MSKNTWPGQQLLPRRLRGGPKDDSVFARKPCVLQHLTTPRRLRDDSVSAFYQHGNDSARAPSTPDFHENAMFYNTRRLRFCRMYHVLRFREGPSDSEHAVVCNMDNSAAAVTKPPTACAEPRGVRSYPSLNLLILNGVCCDSAQTPYTNPQWDSANAESGLREESAKTPRGLRADTTFLIVKVAAAAARGST